MSVFSLYHARQLLASLTGSPEVRDENQYETLTDVLIHLMSTVRFTAPCEASQIFLVENRMPVLADFRTKRSRLVEMLEDRAGDVALVSDSLIGSKDGLFLVTLCPEQDIIEWLDSSVPVEAHLRPAGDSTTLLVAPAKVFCRSHP